MSDEASTRTNLMCHYASLRREDLPAAAAPFQTDGRKRPRLTRREEAALEREADETPYCSCDTPVVRYCWGTGFEGGGDCPCACHGGAS